MGSVLGTIKDIVDGQRERGLRIGALGITSFRPFPIEAVREALKGARQVVVVEKAFSVGFGGVLSTDVAMALTGLAVPVATVVAGLGGRAITKASLQRVFEDALRGGAGPADLPRPEHGLGRAGARAHGPKPAVRTLGREPVSGTWVPLLRGSADDGGPLLPGRELRRRQPARRCRATAPSSPTPSGRTPSPRATGPARAAGRPSGARYALDAAMRATGGQMVAVNATGCLEVFSTPYPETSWQIAWLHSLFGNAPAVATGVAAALRAKGRDANEGRSGRPATEAPSTSASDASRACSSATTTSSSSVTTTRHT